MAGFLTSEQGQEMLDKLVEASERRRRDARTNQWMSRMVEGFAEKAELTPDQTEKVSAIATRSMTAIRDLWMPMRDPNLTAEQRQELVATNRDKMQEIRDAADQEVKAVLNSAQYLIYEEEMSRFGGGMGGFGGRGGRDGGRGGRGGR